MYCTSCGLELEDGHRYCHQCGASTGMGQAFTASVKPAHFLIRPRTGGKIAGVCAGLAQYLGVDVTLIRVIMACLCLVPPCSGLIIYLVCWIAMPKERLLLPAPVPRPADITVAR